MSPPSEEVDSICKLFLRTVEYIKNRDVLVLTCEDFKIDAIM